MPILIQEEFKAWSDLNSPKSTQLVHTACKNAVEETTKSTLNSPCSATSKDGRNRFEYSSECFKTLNKLYWSAFCLLLGFLRKGLQFQETATEGGAFFYSFFVMNEFYAYMGFLIIIAY